MKLLFAALSCHSIVFFWSSVIFFDLECALAQIPRDDLIMETITKDTLGTILGSTDIPSRDLTESELPSFVEDRIAASGANKVRYQSPRREIRLFSGFFKPAGLNVESSRLALLSDDGCTVEVTDLTNGGDPQTVHNNANVHQHLPDVTQAKCGEDKSLHVLPFLFMGDSMYFLEVYFTNIKIGRFIPGDPCSATRDMDGVSLIEFDRKRVGGGGTEPVGVSQGGGGPGGVGPGQGGPPPGGPPPGGAGVGISLDDDLMIIGDDDDFPPEEGVLCASVCKIPCAIDTRVNEEAIWRVLESLVCIGRDGRERTCRCDVIPGSYESVCDAETGERSFFPEAISDDIITVEQQRWTDCVLFELTSLNDVIVPDLDGVLINRISSVQGDVFFEGEIKNNVICHTDGRDIVFRGGACPANVTNNEFVLVNATRNLTLEEQTTVTSNTFSMVFVADTLELTDESDPINGPSSVLNNTFEFLDLEGCSDEKDTTSTILQDNTVVQKGPGEFNGCSSVPFSSGFPGIDGL